MIIALAGRRIDAADAATPRFPIANVDLVTRRIRRTLESAAAAALVSSAACGADLIAQTEAGRFALRRRVILPFGRERFLQSSVIDRPGDWETAYNQLLDAVSATGDLIVLSSASKDDEAYAAVNLRLLDEAEALAGTLRQPVTALLVWDGASRGEGDLTASFGEEARRRNYRLIEVGTL